MTARDDLRDMMGHLSHHNNGGVGFHWRARLCGPAGGLCTMHWRLQTTLKKVIREIRGWPSLVENSGGKWHPATRKAPPKKTPLSQCILHTAASRAILHNLQQHRWKFWHAIHSEGNMRGSLLRPEFLHWVRTQSRKGIRRQNG